MKKFIFGLVIFSLLIVKLSAQTQGEPCDAIVKAGLKSYANVDTSSNLQSMAEQLLNNSQYRAHISNRVGGITIPFDDLPLTPHGSFLNYDSFKNYYLADNKQNLTISNAQRIVKSALAPDVVANWLACMKAHATAPMIEGRIQQNDNVLMIAIQYVPNSLTDPPPKILSIFLDGANPLNNPSNIKEGTVLDTNLITLACRRTGRKAVTCIINTTRGSQELDLPSIDSNLPQQNVVELVPENDKRALDNLAAEWKQKLKSDGVSDSQADQIISLRKDRIMARWQYHQMMKEAEAKGPNAVQPIDQFVQSQQGILALEPLDFSADSTSSGL